MVQVKPFRGIRYDNTKVKIENVITPPYDVINPEERDKFYHKDPNNTIRLILNKEEDSYAMAKETLGKWTQEGVLKREEAPSIYIYEQEFVSDTGETIKRMGFVGAGHLHEYEEGIVIPHERTLSKAKDDRFKLTVSTETYFGVVFMLYHDPTMTIDAILKKHSSSPPEYEAIDHFGIKNRIWILKDTSAIEEIANIMADKKLYIADGHHRYETALNYRNKMREEKGPGDWDYGLMMFINMKAPGLIIYPTHRWIMGFPYADIDIMLDDCMELFDVHPLDMSHDEAYAELEKKGKHHILVYDDRYHILGLKDTALLDTHGDLTKSKPWRSMDVSILHSLLFEKYLDIDQENLQEHVKYTRNRNEAVEKVSDGTYEAAFIMLPPTMEEFIAVANAGEKMPQKSTYFYPKLVTGFVFHKMDGESI